MMDILRKEEMLNCALSSVPKGYKNVSFISSVPKAPILRPGNIEQNLSVNISYGEQPTSA